MNISATIMGLAAGLLFGLATPLSKLALSHLNSFQLAGLLYLGAAIAFLPYMIKNKSGNFKVLGSIGKGKYLVGIIVFGGILGPLFLMLGLQTAKSMSVSIWLNMELVATAILGIVFFKDHLGRYATVGVILTFIASAISSSQESASGFVSGIFVIIACFCWGLDNHLTAIIDGITPQATTFIKGLVGGTVNLIIGLALGGWNIQFQYALIALVVGIFSYGISIYLYITSAQNLGATRSQVLFSTSPFWGIIAANIILGETFSQVTIIAIVVLIGGIIFSNISYHEHTHIHEAIVHIHMHSHEDGHHDHLHDNSINRAITHSHIHTHERIEHTHKHYPDIHHRHNHEK